MSLLVDVYTRDETGKVKVLNANDPAKVLAGFESFRTTFYGSMAARSLGLQLLPSLAHSDLFVEGSDLDKLHDEATQMLEDVDQFIQEAAADRETLRLRLQNILAAVRRARDAHGGVVIW